MMFSNTEMEERFVKAVEGIHEALDMLGANTLGRKGDMPGTTEKIAMELKDLGDAVSSLDIN